MSNRNVRVCELIKREVSDVLHTRYQRESVNMTITRVDVSPDHQNAIVFYSVVSKEEEQANAQRFLKSIGKKLRHEVGKRIVLKNMPAFVFSFDPAIEYETHINQLMDSLDTGEDKQKKDKEDA
mgnify:CR=1 FL=1|tara:strand:- start:564 stop:935 length:372 start_codon:yes stop_codon:yes gene_type:complete